MNKRPLSVTIVGWLFIAAGTIGMLYHAREIDLAHPFAVELVLALIVRALAIVGGIFLLRGARWARWLVIAWLVYHVILSVFHPVGELVMHVLLLAVIGYFLWRKESSRHFRTSPSPKV